MRQFFLIFSTLFLLPFCVLSQWNEQSGSPFITNYTPQAYDAHPQNWDIIQDQRGLMYFANVNGVLEYDGINWRTTELPRKTSCRAMAMDSKGKIYIASSSELGYIEPTKNGDFSFHSLKANIPKNHSPILDVLDVFSIRATIYFRTDHQVFTFSAEKDSI